MDPGKMTPSPGVCSSPQRAEKASEDKHGAWGSGVLEHLRASSGQCPCGRGTWKPSQAEPYKQNVRCPSRKGSVRDSRSQGGWTGRLLSKNGQ